MDLRFSTLKEIWIEVSSELPTSLAQTTFLLSYLFCEFPIIYLQVGYHGAIFHAKHDERTKLDHFLLDLCSD